MSKFHLKTDWRKFGMGAVLLQADPTCNEPLQAETSEIETGMSKFDSPHS